MKEMTWKLEKKSFRWKYIESLEAPRVVHVRTTDMMSKENVYAQVTVRLLTRQVCIIRILYSNLCLWQLHVFVFPNLVFGENKQSNRNHNLRNINIFLTSLLGLILKYWHWRVLFAHSFWCQGFTHPGNCYPVSMWPGWPHTTGNCQCRCHNTGRNLFSFNVLYFQLVTSFHSDRGITISPSPRLHPTEGVGYGTDKSHYHSLCCSSCGCRLWDREELTRDPDISPQRSPRHFLLATIT